MPYSVSNTLGLSTTYLNLGYWKGSCSSIDIASENLIKLVMDTAQLSPADEILDVGFGLGDQDVLIATSSPVKKIIGINNCPSHVDHARALIRTKNLSDRVDLRLGDATNLDFPDESFSVVLAIESAHHFETRESFFKEAYRVLKPQGRLICADVIGPNRKKTWLDYIILYSLAASYHYPLCNFYDISKYREKLRMAKFEQINVTSIFEDVFPPFQEKLYEIMRDPKVTSKLDLEFLFFTKLALFFHRNLNLPIPHDYVLTHAQKA